MDSKFSWTQEYRRSWEETVGDVHKQIQTISKLYNPNRKSIIRHLLLCIDTSSSIEKQDYIPTIRNVLSDILDGFTESFKDANPLSLISFMTCRDIFDKYSHEFNPNYLLGVIGSEDFSFLNCLKSGVEILKNSSYNKEMLILTASIGTKDLESYDQVISDIRKYNIKVNIISICGEVTLFKRISDMSNGRFIVPIDKNHFQIDLMQFIEPLESLESTNYLVKLGFPKLTEHSGLCNCHIRFENSLYECPSCRAFVCILPCQCPVCELQLASPLNISKSQYFTYPLKPFEKAFGGNCIKCKKTAVSRCTGCKNVFCNDCDVFLHNELCFCVYCDDQN